MRNEATSDYLKTQTEIQASKNVEGKQGQKTALEKSVGVEGNAYVQEVAWLVVVLALRESSRGLVRLYKAGRRCKGGGEEGSKERRNNECKGEPHRKPTRQTDEVMVVREERDLSW